MIIKISNHSKLKVVKAPRCSVNPVLLLCVVARCFIILATAKLNGCEQVMSNKKELLWYATACLLEDLLGSCTKLILGALRVPDANSLMCKFFLGLNEIIVVSKSFTGEHKTYAKPQCEWIAMTTKHMVKRKKAAY